MAQGAAKKRLQAVAQGQGRLPGRLHLGGHSGGERTLDERDEAVGQACARLAQRHVDEGVET